MRERIVFERRTMAQRVLFGSGMAAAHLTEEVRRRSAHRVMAIAAPSADGTARRLLADADVAVPTTYSGSETTAMWGLTDEGRKTTGTDDRVLPATVIYDADLTLSLPVGLSVASGLNALAHCVDSLWAPGADPVTTGLAVEGVRLLAAGLPAVRLAAIELPGREMALCGAYLAGVAFSGSGSGMHHKVCHVLGGRFALPHAETHAVMLPHVLAFNGPAAPESVRRLAEALEVDDAVTGLIALHRELGAPRSLGDLGLQEGDLREATDLALAQVPASNPRAVDSGSLFRMLRAAWAGEDPVSQAS